MSARYCYNCDNVIPSAKRCPHCSSVAFYRWPSPRTQTTHAFMDWLPEDEKPPADVSYGTPVRRRGPRGAGPR